jgi:hypothetical protein
VKRPQIKFENWPHWFYQAWPNAAKRWQVLSGYRSIDKATLADIALQNNVFAPIITDNPHEAAIAEGRRQAALAIFKLANVNLDALWKQIEIRSNPQKGS